MLTLGEKHAGSYFYNTFSFKKTPNRSLFFLERNRLIREITELINQINATHERLTKQGRIRSDHGLRYLEDDLYISVVSILKSFNDRFSRKKIRGFTNLCWEEDGITLQIELL